MAVREDIVQAITSLFCGQRAPQVYNFDDLPQYGIFDEDTEEAEQIYSKYRVSMPITIEGIEYFQDPGAGADPDARNFARAEKANELHRYLITTLLQGVSVLEAISGFDRVSYTSGRPVYFTEDSNFVAAEAAFLVVYEDDYSS